MIKFFCVLIGFSVILAGCKKTSTSVGGCRYVPSIYVADTAEVTVLKAWINANHPGAKKDINGFYYEIIAPGAGDSAKLCSGIIIKYTGTLISPSPGFKFDENLVGISFTLGQLILGWQKGIPLIKPGGIINLYIPPSLGYGSAGSGIIPGNAYLNFNVQLLAVQ